MFKFGFSSDGIDNEKNEETVDEFVNWFKSEQIVPNRDDAFINKILEIGQVNVISRNDTEIKYFCSSEVLKILQNEQTLKEIATLKAEQNHSDLITAVYEGGLKIWECTYDLLNYINDNKLDLKDKKVLDLGCGSGVLGIYTLTKGSFCYFQDYNSDVIEYITIPNVLLNAISLTNCKFYCGDWQSFSELLEVNIVEEQKFDFILTSETIYNTANYAKLHQVFERLLKRSGAIYLAAKSFYFGVGGGISLFKDFIDQHGIFKYHSCWKCEEGVKREILKIEFIIR